MEKETIIRVGGMHCVSCAQTIEKNLKKIQGVKEANVNFAAEKAYIKHEDSVQKQQLDGVVTGLGYKVVEEKAMQEHKDHEHIFSDKDIQRRYFLFALILTIPVVIWSWTDFLFPDIIKKELLLFILATPVQFYSGWQFYSNSFKSLRYGALNMDVLVSLGTSAAYFYSVAATFFIEGPIFYETSTILITLIVLGRYLEALTKGKTSETIKKLLDLRPKTASVLKDGQEVQITVEQVKVGDIVIVKPGERIPVDGKVISGHSYVDESLVTGESMPVEKKLNSEVIGGSINKQGSLKIITTNEAGESVLASIVKLVEQAQASKPSIQKLVDKVSSYFIPTVITLAVITFLVWNFAINKDFVTSLTIATAVLVVACPCALGLATPSAIMVGTGLAAQNGVIIKSGDALEKIGKLNAVVLDKTGTLTKGTPEVTDFISFEERSKKTLQLAAMAEKFSEHPLGEAILKKAKSQIPEKDIPDPKYFKSITGQGVMAEYLNSTILIGNLKLLEANKIKISQEIQKQMESLESQGKTVVIMAINTKLAALFAIADTLKPNAAFVVRRLKQMGLEVYMITGDNERTAKAIASQVGIDNVLANVRPEDKVNKIKELQSQNKKVAMVGDGINDAPALSQADIGIAIGSGTDVAKESGSIILLREDLVDIVAAIQLSEKTVKKVKQNLFWAFFYNAIAIPLSALGFIQPEIAGAAMALSSISVVTSSLLLKRYVPEIRTGLGKLEQDIK